MEYEKLAELIEPFINGPFSAMSDELRKSVTNALFPMPHWDELKPGERLSLAKQHDSQLAEYNLGWELDNQIEDIQFEIDKRKLTPTLGQVELDLKNVRISELEAKKAELENSLDYETFEVEHWFSKTVVTSTEAALLLCKHNPNKITSDVTKCCTNPKTGRKDIVQLKQRFDALDKKEPGERTLRDWLEYARSQKIKYHAWIDGYAETLPSSDTKPMPVDMEGVLVTPKGTPTWELKPNPGRMQGYRWPLFKFLKKTKDEGAKTCPKARDVIIAWTHNPPDGIEVISDIIHYETKSGNENKASSKAVQQAIDGLLLHK